MGQTPFLCLFCSTLLVFGSPGFAPASDHQAFVIPSANGTWPGWRGNPQHTGYQRLAGAIRKPRILWRFALGGDPALPDAPQGIKVTDVEADGIPEMIWAPPSSSRVSL